MIDAVLVPGFGGGAKQALLARLVLALAERGVSAQAIALQKRRPTPGLAAETAELQDAWQTLSDRKGAIVGRSFGGRVACRLAASATLPALVLLGFPVRPPGKRRVDDERALAALTCPTLILQGEHDELGAPALLRELIAGRANITLEVVPGAKHSYGRAEQAVVERASVWLAGVLRR